MVSDSSVRRRWLEPLDWVGLGLFALGLIGLVTGLVPLRDAEGTMHRVVPLLLFLGTVIVLAELTARAEVFDVVASWLARLGRGRYPVLFALCVGFATLVTAILNLDTTAVLLTPVMLALATRLEVAPLPFAMTTVWLANTASLLLPVSNLTNLLAADRVGLSPVGFALRMALPELASVLATAACLWLLYWRRRSSERYVVPERHRPPDRRLTAIAAAACVLFVVLVLVGVPLEAAAPVCAVVVVVAFAVRDRDALRWSLVPWRLLVLVTGLFLVMDAIGRLGLSDLLRTVLGDDPGLGRVAAVGAVLANVVNNLPAYVAVEAAVHPDALLGLLVGVNVGPIVAPWASVATLLWYERCRSAGVPISWWRFAATGLVTAVVALTAAVGALALVH
ncbi:SLC13 family permease [Cryptosporangium arvum]|uniref:Na+/H+ antiporter NhaD-like permease n=1 Tax=Cryptosporangium arvum DSM 44712 TaxID=927661 RepID=A0A010ZLV9_9ACTN|nr:SLC13 family permease [Cryptosporangium arvum]EXG79644.1 Na+/H+ antiporter NhaD-like permease [Cryptosporangium arvum DSM 44712]